MNIVILAPIPFWHPGTQELIDGLKSCGINVRALDIFYGKAIDENGVLHDHKPSFLTGFFGRLYLRLFRKKIIDKYLNEGDIVDIHFLEPFYGKYVADIEKKNVKLIATLFGSDLFRTSETQKKMQSPVFEKSDAIVLSENMVPYFEKYFPGYGGKCRFNQYGSLRIDLVDELNTPENRNKFREKYEIPGDKIVVSCGYNGKKEQQHLKLLDQIGKLENFEKAKLFLLLPMTYGRDDPQYIAQIKAELQNMDVSHRFFEERLSDREIAEIRIISDVTINTQTTDALASSIKEAMAAGDVMLVGDWLPYEIYEKIGVFYLSASIAEISERLKEILENMEDYREKSAANREIILNFASWKVLLKDWVKIYEEVED